MKGKTSLRNRRSILGFSLMELVVVIGIVGLLAGVGITSYTGVLQRARDARRKEDLRAIMNALQAYYADNGKYPLGNCPQYGGTPTGGTCYTYSTTSGGAWISQLVPNYVKELPVDPINNLVGPWNAGNYSYAYGNVTLNGQSFDLIAQLENPNDPDRCEIKRYKFCGGAISTNPTICNGTVWCSGTYTGQLYQQQVP